MSKCTHCLQRLCHKHPLQDHGEREMLLKKKAEEASKATLNALIQAQLERLEADAKGTKVADMMDHRLQLDADRANMSSTKRKKRSNDFLATTGLNPSVAHIMMDDSDESDEESSRSRKKHKKDKKKSTKRDNKKSKSEKSKHKKDKKSKTRREKERDKQKSKKRKRSKSESSSDSDSTSSSDSNSTSDSSQ